MTSEQYSKATVIRDDLKAIRGQIDDCKAHEGLRSEAEGFRSYLNDPVTGHTHSTGVLGATKAGETELELEYTGDRQGRRTFAHRTKVRKMLSERGAGAFGKVGGEGYRANAAQAIQTKEYRNAMRSYIRNGRDPSCTFVPCRTASTPRVATWPLKSSSPS